MINLIAGLGDSSRQLWSLWEMLETYSPIYHLARRIQELITLSKNAKNTHAKMIPEYSVTFSQLLKDIITECGRFSFPHTADMAKRVSNRLSPDNYAEIFFVISHLNDSLSAELEREAVFRIPSERRDYFEHDDLFGPQVAAAFPSCARDIRKAGSCYALGQEDACVHHLMLVLERGLNALAAKVGVAYQHVNWQVIIDQIANRVKSLPRGAERDFYIEVNAQFGFLKDAYRNHSEHARDDPYDIEKALSIFNHVRAFMQALEKGGLTE
jgi:hypothetical protein